ncbi:MAG TPA: hypothetical protein VIO11_00430 [Candidatus Methanoperedens sp.]
MMTEVSNINIVKEKFDEAMKNLKEIEKDGFNLCSNNGVIVPSPNIQPDIQKV